MGVTFTVISATTLPENAMHTISGIAATLSFTIAPGILAAVCMAANNKFAFEETAADLIEETGYHDTNNRTTKKGGI